MEKRNVLKIQVILLTIVLAALLAGGCSNHEQDAKAPESKPVAEVKVESVEASLEDGYFQTVGRVKNIHESTVASKVMGMVNLVNVKAGDRVKKGDLLIRIDEQDVRGNVNQASGALAQAEAALTISKTNRDRFLELKKTGSASQAEVDKANFDYDSALGAVKQARGALQTARSYLDEAKVVAPYNGVVVDTMIQQGEMVAPGRPLLRIEGTGALEFETVVNEGDVHSLTTGQAVTVSLDSVDGALEGTISEIVTTSDAGTHSNIVRALLKEKKGVRSGMFGRIRFPLLVGNEASILVPEDRLVRRGQLSAVYIVDPSQTVRLRLVREGRKSGDKVEVLSGLSAGDSLIVSDISGLIDGQPAKVVD